MTIKISVIVPTYNCGQGYWSTLESLRAQTMPNSEFEVIFVDDGSSDHTVSSLRGDTAFDRWSRVIEAEHTGGPGRPRNIGLEHAQGEFVLFLDDDDRLAPEALHRMYDKAVRCEADIVVPKMAGFGRPAPRDTTAEPMERGHILSHPVLLRSMTALKLFRRSLLEHHQLRFPEGKVPLEDHIFTLQAHLLARSVAVVHDYTCYEWVRGESVTSPPHAGTDVTDHCRSVAAIFDIIERHVPPGPVQDSLIARWYQVKLLDRFDDRVLRQSDAGLRKSRQAVRELVRARVPAAVDRWLPANLRVRSAVLRSGGAEALRALARHESGTTHQTRVEAIGWQEGRLALTVSTHLVRQDRQGGRTTVRFVLDGDRIRWDLPADLLAIRGVRAASDVTGDLGATAVRSYVRHRERNSDLYTPTSGQRMSTIALGRNATGLPTAAVHVETTVLFDPATADHGVPVTGLWDPNVLVEMCGWSKSRRIGDDRSPLVESQLRPAFLPDGTLVAPYWTKNGNLSVRVGPANLGALKGAVREPEQARVVEADGVVQGQVPIELGQLQQPVPLSVSLVAGTTQPVVVPGQIVRNGAADLAVLLFAVPAAMLGDGAGGTATWKIQLHQEGRTTRAADLGLSLHRPVPGQWLIGPDAL